jgi:epoxide hydrolase 4
MYPPDLQHVRMQGHGVELHVVRSGDGPAVILLHGFPEFWYSWRHQIPALARAGYSVLAPDLRGYNLSDKPAGVAAYDLRLLVEDVAALIRASGQAPVHVVGHDWGGIVAWTFAGAYPDLVDRLVILNAPHLQLYTDVRWRSTQVLRSWYAFFFQLDRLPEAALRACDFAGLRAMLRRSPARPDAFSDGDVEKYVEAFRKPGALTAALNYYRALRSPAARAFGREARIHAATLVLWGERDPALTPKLAAGVDRVAPSSIVVRLPNVGHWVQNEVPDLVNEALIDFFGSG